MEVPEYLRFYEPHLGTWKQLDDLRVAIKHKTRKNAIETQKHPDPRYRGIIRKRKVLFQIARAKYHGRAGN